MGGEDGQSRVRQRAEEHQHVAVLALAAHLLGVHPGGLVAVVAVGDQQLGAGQCRLEGRDRLRIGDPPQRVPGALVVGHGCERLARGRGLERRSGSVVGIREEAEDG